MCAAVVAAGALEGWAPELKQKRGRPASAVADGHELAVQSFISLILQIEGQR